MMTLAVDAIFENGVLKPLNPLELAEHQKVHLIARRIRRRLQRPGPSGTGRRLKRFKMGLLAQWPTKWGGNGARAEAWPGTSSIRPLWSNFTATSLSPQQCKRACLRTTHWLSAGLPV